jgi:hypothetical protein
VSLETIVTAFEAGATAEEIAQQYASVDLAGVYAVISYVLDHRREVDEYVVGRPSVLVSADRRRGLRTERPRWGDRE